MTRKKIMVWLAANLIWAGVLSGCLWYRFGEEFKFRWWSKFQAHVSWELAAQRACLEIYQARQQWQLASKTAQNMLDSRQLPSNEISTILYQLAWCYYQQQDFANAEKALTQLQQQPPSHWHEQGQLLTQKIKAQKK